MRELEINGSTFVIKPLTRAQVKDLKASGFNLLALTVDNADEAMEKVFEMVFSTEQMDMINGAPYPDALKLWRAVLAETYGSPDEEKN